MENNSKINLKKLIHQISNKNNWKIRKFKIIVKINIKIKNSRLKRKINKSNSKKLIK
jgi:hypothetical protein